MGDVAEMKLNGKSVKTWVVEAVEKNWEDCAV